jgi:UDP-N-acetylmuramate dehydrogenase
MVVLEDMKEIFHGHLGINERLAPFTSFRIGGPADYYMEPEDREDIVRLLGYLKEHGIAYTVVGNGSNLLISDEGIRGAVINLEHGLSTVTVRGETVIADAGVRLVRFVDFCIRQGLKGVEMLAGIPGTIGGAVVMNAGAHGGEISDYLVEVEALRGGSIVKVKKNDAGFSYRRSGFQNDIVLGASFALPHGELGELMRRRRELLLKRNQTQPLNLPNSGSVFKNPTGMFAAKLIEEAGLKGTRRGGAQISEKHGNFIVNDGSAAAADVLELMLLAKKTVAERFAVKLEPEVKLLGFRKEIVEALYA